VNEGFEENIPLEVSGEVNDDASVNDDGSEISTINESEDPYAPKVLESFSSLSTTFADFLSSGTWSHEFCTEIVALANLVQQFSLSIWKVEQII
jgi:hypothetical protein